MPGAHCGEGWSFWRATGRITAVSHAEIKSRTNQADSREVANLLDGIRKAHLAKNAAAIAAAYSKDAELYTLAPPLSHRGVILDKLEDWLATWEGGINIESYDRNILIDGKLAVVRGLTHMRGRKTDGYNVDLWFRVTTVLEKNGSAWRIVHEHESVPFYMDGSLKAAVDLRPEPAKAA
jgi:ketosteroid isomerase-like protein